MAQKLYDPDGKPVSIDIAEAQASAGDLMHISREMSVCMATHSCTYTRASAGDPAATAFVEVTSTCGLTTINDAFFLFCPSRY